jgi:hypothetical protein
MNLVEFCEEEFNKNALELFNMSEILNDNWRINEKNGKIFLTKQQKLTIDSQQEKVVGEEEADPSAAIQIPQKIISIEYHVLFHPSYQVPVLFFNAHSGGTGETDTLGIASRNFSLE